MVATQGQMMSENNEEATFGNPVDAPLDGQEESYSRSAKPTDVELFNDLLDYEVDDIERFVLAHQVNSGLWTFLSGDLVASGETKADAFKALADELRHKQE